MTPEQKAKELIEKYLQYVDCGDNRYTTKVQTENSKKCALICVDEIIKSNPANPLKGSYIELYSDMIDEAIEFWQSVRTEIINFK